MHNFVSQFTWRVVNGGSVSLHDPPSNIHQLQLTTWQVVAQSCVFLCVYSITHI